MHKPIFAVCHVQHTVCMQYYVMYENYNSIYKYELGLTNKTKHLTIH